MLAGNIKEDFPWAQFSLVVEYERDDSEKFSSLCQRLNIRYLTIVITDKSMPGKMIISLLQLALK